MDKRPWSSVVSSLGVWEDVVSPESFDLGDICHRLCNICRWGGGTSRFYSVAEHSLRVASVVSKADLVVPALLHDAAEAYLGDVPTGIKGRTVIDGVPFAAWEAKYLEGLGLAYGVGLAPMAAEVKAADLALLATEAEVLINGHWGPVGTEACAMRWRGPRDRWWPLANVGWFERKVREALDLHHAGNWHGMRGLQGEIWAAMWEEEEGSGSGVQGSGETFGRESAGSGDAGTTRVHHRGTEDTKEEGPC